MTTEQVLIITVIILTIWICWLHRKVRDAESKTDSVETRLMVLANQTQIHVMQTRELATKVNAIANRL